MTIDVLTKRAWAIPIKRKYPTDMVKTFKDLFQQKEPQQKLQTDKGLEFRAKPIQNYLKIKKEE